MDIESSFVNSLLNEEVYVEQSLGFVNHIHLSYVYKIYKALYDLKQALLHGMIHYLNFALA